MAIADLLPRARTELLALLAPPVCLACREPLCDAGAALCVGCRRALPWLVDPRCPRCALQLPHRRCPARGAPYDVAWAALAHEGPARALVTALKFRGALPVTELMAAQIAATVPPGLLAGATLVPVPLHPARRRARGFDQAALIAQALARRGGGLPLSVCLRRGGAATRQMGTARDARLSAGRLAIRAVAPVPARVVLVDDVHTTGATFAACAAELRSAGCAYVIALAYARALRR